MPSPISGSAANSNFSHNKTALQAIANMRFISDSVAPINNAIALGKSYVNLLTYEHCELSNLMYYYIGLGYQIGFPNVLYGLHQYQAVPQIQGPNQAFIRPRMIINWSLPFNPQPLQVISTQTGPYTLSVNNEVVFADSTSADLTISLPLAPFDGWVETINWSVGTNAVSVSGNGNNINGSATPLTIAALNGSATLLFMQGYGWVLFP